MSDDLILEAEKITSSIDIPSQPQLLLQIHEEVLKPEPNFRVLKEYVSQDIGMSAKVIKLANSAFFGLRNKVHSIENALTVLGLNNFTNIIVSSSFRDLMALSSNSAEEYDELFNHSMHAARLCQFITNKVSNFGGAIIFPSQTYMAGLFHDCGIMILAKKFDDYFEDIKCAKQPSDNLIDVEEGLYKTNHSVVGYVVAKSWQLPEIVTRVIQHHHDPYLSSHDDPTLRSMLAINLLAETVLSILDDESEWSSNIFGIQIDEKALRSILDELNFDMDDFKDIVSTAQNLIG